MSKTVVRYLCSSSAHFLFSDSVTLNDPYLSLFFTGISDLFYPFFDLYFIPYFKTMHFKHIYFLFYFFSFLLSVFVTEMTNVLTGIELT